MPIIYFVGKEYTLAEGENLLSGLLNQQARMPFSCRAGICHSCLLKLDQGMMPENSQIHLSTTQQNKRYFLACQSHVHSDLHVSIPERDEIPARAVKLTPINATEIILTLSTRFPFKGHAGELVGIISQTGVQSQLPIQVISAEKNTIEFVVKRKAGDEFSRWLHDKCQNGDGFMLSTLSGRE